MINAIMLVLSKDLNPQPNDTRHHVGTVEGSVPTTKWSNDLRHHVGTVEGSEPTTKWYETSCWHCRGIWTHNQMIQIILLALSRDLNPQPNDVEFGTVLAASSFLSSETFCSNLLSKILGINLRWIFPRKFFIVKLFLNCLDSKKLFISPLNSVWPVKSCPKMISLAKWKILTILQKFA